MIRYKRHLIAPVLAICIFLQGCGGGSFATQLRVILAASGPLIESLNLGSNKQAVVRDFTDLASGAATLSDDLKACGDSKPCKLDAVTVYERTVDTVIARGHFGLSPKLQTIQGIVRGIIASAKIFFGQRQSIARGGSARVVTEQELKTQINELRAAMSP